jgi:hypothetical protein
VSNPIIVGIDDKDNVLFVEKCSKMKTEKAIKERIQTLQKFVDNPIKHPFEKYDDELTKSLKQLKDSIQTHTYIEIINNLLWVIGIWRCHLYIGIEIGEFESTDCEECLKRNCCSIYHENH